MFEISSSLSVCVCVAAGPCVCVCPETSMDVVILCKHIQMRCNSACVCTDWTFCLPVCVVASFIHSLSLFSSCCGRISPSQSLLYLEAKHYQSLQLAACDSILTDLQRSKQSPFCLVHFSTPHPQTHLSDLSHCPHLSIQFYHLNNIYSYPFLPSLKYFLACLPPFYLSLKCSIVHHEANPPSASLVPYLCLFSRTFIIHNAYQVRIFLPSRQRNESCMCLKKIHPETNIKKHNF